MPKTILYTDGGCSGNGQTDLSKRKMVAVVTNEAGEVAVEKNQNGGSNNIAELLAVKEALLYAIAHGYDELEIRTDSRNNLAWTFGKKVGKGINDRDAVILLKTMIDAARSQLKNFNMIWIPRGENQAGIYIEQKYKL